MTTTSTRFQTNAWSNFSMTFYLPPVQPNQIASIDIREILDFQYSLFMVTRLHHRYSPHCRTNIPQSQLCPVQRIGHFSAITSLCRFSHPDKGCRWW